MGQISALGVAFAYSEESKRMLNSNISKQEFDFACKLLSDNTSTTVSMGEFILLELMRFGCADAEQILQIRSKFMELDQKNRGELSIEEIQERNILNFDKSTEDLPPKNVFSTSNMPLASLEDVDDP